MSRFVIHAALLGLAALPLTAPLAPAQKRNLYTNPSPQTQSQQQEAQQSDAPPPPPPPPPSSGAYAGTYGGYTPYAMATYGPQVMGNYGGYGYGSGLAGRGYGNSYAGSLQGLSSYTQAQG